ncbi:MAG: polysaccharide biosynthesis tyrosine autokinase [Leeuwenhoekiella sp.]
MSSENLDYLRSDTENVNLRKVLTKYLRHWPWFLLGVILFCGLAYLYVQRSTPVYRTISTIVIKDNDKNRPSPEATAFAELGLLSSLGVSSIENELGLLRSRRLMSSAANKLNLQVQYFVEGEWRPNELYNLTPIRLQVTGLDEEKLNDFIGNDDFQNTLLIQNWKTDSTLAIGFPESSRTFTATYDKPLKLDFGTITARKNPNFNETHDYSELIVKIYPLEEVTSTLNSRLNVTLLEENSSLIELSIEDAVQERGQDVLNQLVFEYNSEAIRDNEQIAKKSKNFIDDRIKVIDGVLDTVETGKENFKENYGLTDINAESQTYIRDVSDLARREADVNTQLSISNMLLQEARSNRNRSLLPTNLGLNDNNVSSQIDTYNELVQRRDRLLVGGTERNPAVINLNSQLDQLINNILRSLRQNSENLQISLADIQRQKGRVRYQIAAVPAQERELREITREQGIKEDLFLFLMKKREENSIAMEVQADKAKTVDPAYSLGSPVFPQRKIIFLGAGLFGLAIPFLVIYFNGLLDDKVKTRKDIEKFGLNIPIVGEILKGDSKKILQADKNDRSVLSESFRILVTNLHYQLAQLPPAPGGRCIFVTSSVQGEGKTFSALNLGRTFTHGNKRVVVIGGDMRSPKLQPFAKKGKNDSNNGLSEFLANPEVSSSEIISDSFVSDDLKIIASGGIPANPTELLSTDRIQELFTVLKTQFDYIIVDTTPCLLVADTFLISRHADLTLYVIRSGYTKKSFIESGFVPEVKGKLKNMCILLNGTSVSQQPYGSAKYVYGDEKPNLWKRMFS